MKPTHVIVYSHGFGVKKDDRGLFTSINASMPKVEHVMFDYNEIDDEANTLTVSPLEDQAAKLKVKMADVLERYPRATIDMVCHSQGCVVAALAKPDGIRKVIFLAPPSQLRMEKLIQTFSGRPGTDIHMDAVSRLGRRDGSVTIVPAQYWTSRLALNPIRLYNRFAEQTDLVVVEAARDEVLGSTSFDGLNDTIRLESLDANHDFTDGARKLAISFVQNELYD
jgi:hypothetical protein